MKKAELLARIEALEERIDAIERVDAIAIRAAASSATYGGAPIAYSVVPRIDGYYIWSSQPKSV